MPKKIDINERYIIIKVDSDKQFDEDTLHTVWVDQNKGIQEVIGRTKDGPAVQSYLFDKEKWSIDDAREWLRTKNATKAELLNKNRLYVNSAVHITSSLPKLLSANFDDMPIIDKSKEAFAQFHDKYYYFVEGVHEGANANGAHFFADELTKAYKTMAGQPIDWEHDQEEIIGVSQEVELVTKTDKPLAVGYTGILWRLSPYLQVSERVGEKLVSRDEIIKDRYLKGTLASSMECYFDQLECMECQARFDDWLMFEFHVWERHRDILESGGRVNYGLRGIQFVGNGIVEFPADPEAYVSSLRSDEENTLKDIEDAALTDKYGDFGHNIAFSRLVASADPDDYMIYGTSTGKNIAFASEKYAKNSKKDEKNKPKIGKKDDNIVDDPKGDKTIMFELLKKVQKAKNLNEALAECQRILRDFKGDKALTEEAQKDFASEISEVVTHFISKEDFEIADIFTVTDKEKLDAVEAARTKEIEKANGEKEALQATITSLESEKSTLETAVQTKEEEITSLKEAEKNKEMDAKVEAFMSDLKNDGVDIAGAFAETVKASVRERLQKENAEEEIKEYRKSMLTAFKREDLLTASDNAGTTAADATDNKEKDLDVLFADLDKEMSQA